MAGLRQKGGLMCVVAASWQAPQEIRDAADRPAGPQSRRVDGIRVQQHRLPEARLAQLQGAVSDRNQVLVVLRAAHRESDLPALRIAHTLQGKGPTSAKTP